MLNRHLEPDFDIGFRCECGECEGCINNWEFGFRDEEPTERQLAIAEFNYECLVYNELEKVIGGCP